jgi:enoyl-CoA hydratase/carnithine racemase
MTSTPLQATRYAVADRIATITLDRPERLNAWTAAMGAEYKAHLQAASVDPEVRVVVVTGNGRGFCAGADSDDLAGHASRGSYDSGEPDDVATPGYGVRPEFDAEFAYHFGVDKPILAAVNGPAAGIGFVLSCYCDLRFAARGATFTTAHGRLGLPCAFGLAWLLPKLIGLPPALDLILSSRSVDADEAHALGLVTEVVDGPDLLEHVYAYATVLATTVSPASLAASKRQVYEAFHQTAAEAVRAAEARLDPMMAGPDYREGVAALREKRVPVFGDPPPGP